VAKTSFLVGKTEIRLVQGDITDLDVEAIVNTANSTLMGGGGVDGTIHRRGGPQILEECKRIRTKRWPNGLPTGMAVLTSGGHLKARHVIHAVGPVWRGGKYNESELLAQAYRSSLELAVSAGLKTIAFPSISTGAYGYPVDEASGIAIATVKEFLEREHGLDCVMFVLFTERDFGIYKEKMKAFSRE
jgi:O-acetyl-ADP-ribose deacetylase (regulator of RNase III)